MGQLALEFRLIVEQQSLGRTQFEPSVEFDLDGILAVPVGFFAQQHHHEPPEQFDLVHLDLVPWRLRLFKPRLLVVVGKLMVNETLTPQRQLHPKT